MKGNEMKRKATCFLMVLIFLLFWQNCFAREEIVIADKLTIDDIENALLSGAIASNCGMSGFPEHGATSLNPDSVIIKGIFQDGDAAKIHFMGRFKASIRADERAAICESDLMHLDSGEWVDPNGSILKK